MNNVERLAEREARKTKKKVVTLITPFPISNAVFGEKIEGSVLKYMFPCSGVITRGMIKLKDKPREKVNLSVEIFNEHTSNKKSFKIDDRLTVVELNLNVLACECLDVSIIAEEIIPEVWLSFLWYPSRNNVVKENYYEEAEDASQNNEDQKRLQGIDS